ncbi:MAG: bifunctional hydroxymethylpyrimidine kinase/phosphomethylpyrimidine kinase [Nitrospirae bacterium]|nr:bifunctional hydroxymethylpyrimidine kinase/phosphomethylpyrimidine kinase [Nitrospirota bacterium]
MKIALTIAGSDPTGGAGLQVDLKVFKSFDVYGLSVPSVLTAQNTDGVYDIYELPPLFFSQQIKNLLSDISPDAVKTGMLYSPEIIKITAQKVKEYSLGNLVVDPVTVSSTGVSLIKNDALDTMKDYLFPLAKVITPNIYEATIFTGINIDGTEDMKVAAMKLKDLGPEAVIITGGHLEEVAIDLLWDGKEFLALETERIGGEYHGTGCVFSSSITACLALGYDVRESFVKAKDFVSGAIKTAISIGKGMKILNI